MSGLPVIRTSQVEDDLISIWLHIARENTAAADRVLDRIDARWRQLAAHPFSGAPRDDLAAGIRHLVVGEYLTFYRVGEDEVEILRILHGSRNIEPEDFKVLKLPDQ